MYLYVALYTYAFIHIIYTCGIQPEKEGNPATCNNMNEPGGYHAE